MRLIKTRNVKVYVVLIEDQGITEIDLLTTNEIEADCRLEDLSDIEDYLIDDDDPEFRQSVPSAWIEEQNIKIEVNI